jgi:hypothetical protein
MDWGPAEGGAWSPLAPSVLETTVDVQLGRQLPAGIGVALVDLRVDCCYY